jgi:AraC-like DNA-binding protein
MRTLYSGTIPVDNLHISLLVAERLIIDPSWWTGYMQDNFWRLYRNAGEGASLLLDGSTPYALEQNRFYFVPASVNFKCHCAQEVDHFYIHFDITGLPRLALQNLFNGPVSVAKSDSLDEMFHGLLHDISIRRSNLATQLRLKALIYEALLLCLPVAPEEQDEQGQINADRTEIVRPALDYVEGHLAQHISITDLACRCCMSKDYFIRRFRQCIGITPLQYILQQRVRYASQELLYTSKTIDDIACEAGFGNRFYFTRAFTKSIGVSPAHYRKMRSIRPSRDL